MIVMVTVTVGVLAVLGRRELRGVGLQKEIKPALLNLNPRDDRRAYVRIDAGVEVADRAWMILLQMRERVGIEDHHAVQSFGSASGRPRAA